MYSSYFCVLNYYSTKSTVTEAMYTDVQVRGLKKAVFRRLTSKLNIYKALDSKDDAKSALVELKKAFTAFQEAHDVVCAPIIDFGEQMKEEQEFMDVQLQYTQCLNDINSWLYGDNSDVPYAKPSLAINSSAVNARDTGKSQGDNRGKQSICLKCHAVHPLHAADICCKQCNLNHSTYTHVDDVIVNKDVDVDVNTVMPSQMQTTNSAGTAVTNSSADDTPSSDYTFMSTVSVVVNESYKTHALLDSDSTNSFITSEAVKSLGLSSKTVIYKHSTVDTLCMTTNTKVVNFILYSLDGTESLSMSNVFVVEEVPYTYSPFRDLSTYPHLSDVPISPVHPPAKVDLLIGQDNSEALVPLQVLGGNPGDPFAVLTKFGYSLNGVVPGSSPDCVVSNFVHTPIDAKAEVLSDIADVQVGSTLKSFSISTDCEAVDVCHGESIVIDSHVGVPISREVSHVDNYLLTPAGKISVLSDCDNDVKAIISKGLAEDILVDEVKNHDPMTCYVPFHPVFKRSGDIYFLSDCSNKSQEYSFDDCVFHSLDSTPDVMFPDISLHLSLINDCLLSVGFTDETSNLDFKSESVLSFYGFDPTKCFVYDPPMARLIPDFNMSLDVDTIFAAHASQPESMLSNSCDFDPRKCFVHDLSMFRLIPDYNMSLDFESIVDSLSQLVSKALGISWAMPLKQWLSWLKYFGSWTNNPCPMLCCQFVFDNG